MSSMTGNGKGKFKLVMSKEDTHAHGYVTAEYTFDFICPSVVAIDGDKVVGYEIVSTNDIRDQHQLLWPAMRRSGLSRKRPVIKTFCITEVGD